MNGAASDRLPELTPRAGREAGVAWPGTPRPQLRSREQQAGDHYSRRVVLLKRLLPILGLTLLILVAIWPRLEPLLESVRLGFPLIDLREARELRMLNPRYAGIDHFNRPFVVTAAVGRQVPNRDDLMALERPKAEMAVHGGALVVVTAATAVYQSQAQLLDLFDEVTLLHENGMRFETKTAHVDVAASSAEGHDPVTGRGPSGDVDAQGFRILDKGEIVIFEGRSNLLLKGSRPSPKPAISPPTLPAEVEEAAARIEAAAASALEEVARPGTAAQPPAALPVNEHPAVPAQEGPDASGRGKPDAG